MNKPKAWVAWSTGKDAAWALHAARRDGDLEVTGLLATITRDYGRVSMHGVREELVTAQARAVGVPLHPVYISAECSNEDYEAAMREALEAAAAEGVSRVIFGDIFLADVRAYREEKMAGTRLAPVFPLWASDTAALARDMIKAGVEAYVTCLDPRKVPRELAGRRFDEELLSMLPAGADPCGENGEFHTFVADGPVFQHPINIRIGETVERDAFVFTDVLPASWVDPT